MLRFRADACYSPTESRMREWVALSTLGPRCMADHLYPLSAPAGDRSAGAALVGGGASCPGRSLGAPLAV